MFCSRTLNLRSIRAIGYDMDYTLVHYRVEEWERRTYTYIRRRLAEQGWPIEDLEFDPDLVIRGLIVDAELGNLVQANRFGYVKQAFHGTRPLSFEQQRKTYAATRVALSNRRFQFLNTLFSLSEGCLYLQLVDRLDARALPGDEVLGYADLWRKIRSATDATHMEGHLKGEIVADPDRFVELDPELPLTLLDQRHAGKLLFLITNSDWGYSCAMMSYAFDRYLPRGRTWRDLFDLVIVSAGKPAFFNSHHPLYEVVNDEGLLRSCPGGVLRPGGAYVGGHAALIEKQLDLEGDEILYVGDHMYADVYLSKIHVDWRTAMVLRELEGELGAIAEFAPRQQELERLMQQKEQMEHHSALLRLAIQRQKAGYAPEARGQGNDFARQLAELREGLLALDEHIAPLARAASELRNPRWGLLLRAGNDKSHLARQLERYADIYMSRVSNLRYLSPFAYLRSPRGSLPHDPVRGFEPDPDPGAHDLP